MYENSRFLKNRFTFCGVNTNFGQQWAPPAYYHLTPIVSKGKHWIIYGNTSCSIGWPIYLQSKLSLYYWIGRKNHNYVHIDTYHYKPELILWWQINTIVFNMRFLSPTNQKYADSTK